jgi:TonB family protein
MTEATVPPADEVVPAPAIDPSLHGAFHALESEDARRRQVTVGTIIAALAIHLVLVALLLVNWYPSTAPPIRPIKVTLLRQLPKPLPRPKPKPQPKLEQPKPHPQPVKPPPKPAEAKPKPPPRPVTMSPRESGPDLRTEAMKNGQPKTALPRALPVAPKAEPVPPPKELLPQPPAPKPIPPKAVAKEAGRGKVVAVPFDRLPPALAPQRAARPPIRNLVLRLPSQGGGTGTRDLAGDPYLNRLMAILERNRVYPPAEDFVGALARQAIFTMLVNPSGNVTNVALLASTGVERLDEAAREMITDSIPFPRLPPDYPPIPVPITIFIPIFPHK